MIEITGLHTPFYIDGSAGKTSSGFGIHSPLLNINLSIPVSDVLTSFEIETMALEYLLSFIEKEGLRFVNIYSDCQSLVENFFKKSHYSEIAKTHQISIRWIPRSANRVADRLAGEARLSIMPMQEQSNKINRLTLNTLKNRNVNELELFFKRIAVTDREVEFVRMIFSNIKQEKFIKKMKKSLLPSLMAFSIQGQKRKTLPGGQYLSSYSHKISTEDVNCFLANRKIDFNLN